MLSKLEKYAVKRITNDIKQAETPKQLENTLNEALEMLVQPKTPKKQTSREKQTPVSNESILQDEMAQLIKGYYERQETFNSEKVAKDKGISTQKASQAIGNIKNSKGFGYFFNNFTKTKNKRNPKMINYIPKPKKTTKETIFLKGRYHNSI